MKKWQKNPWYADKSAKEFQVIVEPINAKSSDDVLVKEFRKFEDAKSYYLRLKSDANYVVYFGHLNHRDWDIDIVENFEGQASKKLYY